MKKSLVLSMVAFIVAVCVPSDLFAQSSSVVREAERREVQGTQENAGGQNEISAKNRAVPEVVKVPARSWSIGKYEVTQAEYKMIMGENPSHFKGGNLPVENVSWNDATEFCEKLTEYARKEGLIKNDQSYRLPTVAEWQYACRAGTTTKYCSGDSEEDLSRVAWWEGNSEGKIHPVGTKEPNAWGIYDMHGNVWEWCQDSKGSHRLFCGGRYSGPAVACASLFSATATPKYHYCDLGFRVVLDERDAFLPVVINVPARNWSIGKYEVTQAEYKMIMGENPSLFKGDNLPVEKISWYNAVEFCKKLTEYARKKVLIGNNQFYRLPTSEEWEYACRAGTKTKYCSGDSEEDLSRVGWWKGNSEDKTHPVGEKEPNAWGIYDMHGNVREWCQDSMRHSQRVLCSGAFYQSADCCKSSMSFPTQSSRKVGVGIGFRVVLDGRNDFLPVVVKVPERNWSIGKYEVTQAEYKMIMGENPSLFKGGNLPVENVSWDDAVAFCEKLTKYARDNCLIKNNQFYRLPTSEEWEYACRAGSKTKYCSGDSEEDLSRVAWWEGNSEDKTHPVGEKEPNAWGIYDMHGNVWEWCQDSKGSRRPLRGGRYSGPAVACRSSFLCDGPHNYHHCDLGFRVVLDGRNDFFPIVKVPGHNWSIGKYEVTQAEYKMIMGENPSLFKGGSFPVDSVSWEDAVAFCEKLTEYARETGVIENNQFYRLPTSEEWEYACRAGTKTKYCSGDSEEDLSRVGWWKGNSEDKTHSVGEKEPNAWGIYDMHGNVREWCRDSSDSRHINCGGGCSDNADRCEATFVDNDNTRSGNLGFRVVLEERDVFLPAVVKVPDRNWSIGKYKVTQAEYKMIMGENSSSNKGDSLPVENVSWDDAVAFCEKLTEYAREKGLIKNNQFYRLPTSKEWGYACRAGTKISRSIALYPVDKPNAWGIYDMCGNVRELCQESWTNSYCGSGVASGFRVVLEERDVFLPVVVKMSDRNWSIGKYEVTQAEYEKIMGENPSSNKGDNLPVENVSRNDAAVFCEKLTKYERDNGLIKNNQFYRLPTAEEWGYACRAGTTTKYCSGDSEEDLSRVGWWKGNSEDKTHPVGEKEPNAWGIYDMHGNVREWCQDLSDSRHINCGGGYRDNVDRCEATFVDNDNTASSGNLGFRVVLDEIDAFLPVVVKVPARNWSIGKYEVTQAQYKMIMGENPSSNKGDNLPVENVSWDDAAAFCEKLTEFSRETGVIGNNQFYRLPTSGEWECACRAGTTTKYCSGDSEKDLSRVGWWKGNSGGRTHPVGTKEPNDWGIYDMHGNVREWCQDSRHANCGGGCIDNADRCEATSVDSDNTTSSGNLGFRVVLDGGNAFLPVVVKVPDRNWSIGKYEVTQAEYEEIMGENPSLFKGDNLPVENVSWYNAVEFCKKLTEYMRQKGLIKNDQFYRLPTSEEWEYACRAGTTTKYCSGDSEEDLSRVAWWEGNSGYKTHRVGAKEPNAWGIYDMHGNVEEWCRGLFDCGFVETVAGNAAYYLDCPAEETLGFRVVLDEKDAFLPVVVKVPDRNWSIGKYEVIQAEYEKIMGKNPSGNKGDNLPVENVSWDDAVAFCEKLTRYARENGLIKNNQFYRLPTAEDWEYACRSGTTTKYCSGDSEEDLSRVAWWAGNSGGRTHPVGEKEPNAWGIYGMHGNVREWCLDSIDSRHINCGGGYRDNVDRCEATSVDCDNTASSGNLGFRVVLDERNDFLPVVIKVSNRNWSIGKYEVTQAEYEKIMGKNPSGNKGDNLPVEHVSWNDAVAFCEKLTEYARKEGLIKNNQLYRLPTSGEWEYACRAGTKTKYCSGDSEEDLSRVAWWEGNSEGKTHPVGEKEPNAWGIYDMHGNVWEWCQDSRGLCRVLRGGGCGNFAFYSESLFVRSDRPNLRDGNFGFRVVLDERNGFFPVEKVPARKWSIGKYEVTQSEYKMIMGENPSSNKGDSLPVENVSWNDATEFCEKLTEYARKEGLIKNDQSYRLPTVAEWQYACRAGTTTKYCSGDSEEDLSRVGWWEGNSEGKTHPVGTKEPNAWGIYDMHGNVWEWCRDLKKNSRGAPCHFLRGGCCIGDEPCLCSFVYEISEGLCVPNTGFRVILEERDVFLPVVVKVPNCNWSIGKYEVTQAQYKMIMGENPSGNKGDNLPVEHVSWNDAVAFCEKLTKYAREKGLIGNNQSYRLPTSGEWEYACRAGTKTKYCSGDSEEDLSRVAWWKGNSADRTHRVGAKEPNAWGIYDMHGNVEEWCQDLRGSGRIVRGGAFYDFAECCESRMSSSQPPTNSNAVGIGFRVVFDGRNDFLPVVVKVPDCNWSIGKYEVTQAEYKMIMGENPSDQKGGSFPVENVSWNDAVAYCKKLTEYAKKIGLIEDNQFYRLPTVDEWKYACCAGTKTKYCSGDSEDDLSRVGWWKDNSEDKTHPVGTKEPNAWGIYDMHGNVREWCQDLKKGSSGSSCRVLCGGGYSDRSYSCCSSYSPASDSDSRTGLQGFRVVLGKRNDFLLVVKVPDRNWSIGKYEVTQAEYDKIMCENPSSNEGDNNVFSFVKRDNLPVENVSWNDAVAFCKELTKYAKKIGLIEDSQFYRLPTAEEWEYACCAGTKTKYCSGDSEEDLSRVGWWEGNSEGKTHPVGTKEPNAWGIYDMHGNVWEWCQDSRGSLSRRGGGYSSYAERCKSLFKDSNNSDSRSGDLGFRVVLGDFLPVVKVENRNWSIGKYEVTQAEYKMIMGKNPSSNKGDSLPVENVSWNDATEFCEKLTEYAREKGVIENDQYYRLPTAAEWQYACRAGTTTKYCSGDSEEDLSRVAWWKDNSDNETHPVGEKEPNAWGIYDMHGNVQEWCRDLRGLLRVVCGGACSNAADFCEPSFVCYRAAKDRNERLGFRVVLAPTGQ